MIFPITKEESFTKDGLKKLKKGDLVKHIDCIDCNIGTILKIIKIIESNAANRILSQNHYEYFLELNDQTALVLWHNLHIQEWHKIEHLWIIK